MPQSYTVWIGARDKHAKERLLPSQEIAVFDVVGDMAKLGLKGEKAYVFSRDFPLLLPYEWAFDNCQTRVQIKIDKLSRGHEQPGVP
jgi:hypothetical protein